ncbi:Ankyrin repeat-containing protein [Thalictrum thalictroides]|uniref:Ankyrin repeat-containing protein n=1 Tax=Thalictrum thalictroides TaxID=46969 RepID=A0A7J6VQL5_THATH|nr:Ankyrin repeat-containing protein [Thalictrum thalictroides]
MATDPPHKLMKELFMALMKHDQSKVMELYKRDVQLYGNNIEPYHLEVKYPKEYPLTTSHDTVLHVAMYSGQNELVRDLLQYILHKYDSDILLKVNDLGDTILHEATTTDKIDPLIISLMLSKRPDLLTMRNKNDESPLFRAVHFGSEKMFKDLADRVDQLPHPEVHRRRADGVNILHIAILNEFFDLALEIAKRYPDLLSQREKDGVPNSDDGEKNKSNVVVQYYRTIALGLRRINRLCWNRIFRGWLLMDEVWKERERHESAFRLVKYLIEYDDSWKDSDPGGDPENIVVTHEHVNKYWNHLRIANVLAVPHLSHSDTNHSERGITSHTASLGVGNPTGLTDLEPQSDLMDKSAFENSFTEPKVQDTNTHKLETPLLVATSNGIEEIVEAILKMFPQAIEHVSSTGQNILHVAVLNRQKKIFDIVEKNKIPMTRLSRRIDKKGNTVLHQVGINVGIYRGQMPGPALQLQEELLWFKRVKEVLPPHFRMHLNEKGLNAFDFFQNNNKDLLRQAQDWLKRTSQSCSVVAVLIATVAFAAAYTVPGGNQENGQDSGLPILVGETFFLVFTVMDVVSLACSLTSVVMFLSILTSPFQYQDFKRSLPRKLTLGFTFLFMAVATMMLAFAATIILIIKSEKHVSKTLIYTVAFLPVSIFAVMQFPIYVALTNTAQYTLLILKKALPSYYVVLRPVKTIVFVFAVLIEDYVLRPVKTIVFVRWLYFLYIP